MLQVATHSAPLMAGSSANGGRILSSIVLFGAAGAAMAAGTPAGANTVAAVQTDTGDRQSAAPLRDAIESRLQQLRDIAVEDGSPFSELSAQALETLVLGQAGVHSKPAITLQDDGTVRAIWRNVAGEQAALLFRDNGTVQFVAFALCGDGTMGRVTGVTTSAQALAQLKASGSFKLLRA